MDTPITTAARRIQRDLSASSVESDVYYDVDGYRLAATPYGTWMSAPEGTALNLRGGEITQREVQDWLDGWTAFREQGEDWEYTSPDMYVSVVADARASEKRRKEAWA